MSLVFQSSGGGQITIQEPATASNFTQNLPAADGTIALISQLPSTGPAFSAFQTSAQTLTNGVTAKVTFETEVFDTNSNYASSRFTPTVAGYYLLIANVSLANASSSAFCQLSFYKNGGALNFGSGSVGQTGALFPQSAGSSLTYFNGSTDYIEVFAYTSGGSTATSAATFFSGVLVRAA
jgi:hypothetical protein